MASCYGCTKHEVKFAGEYCKECKPKQDITQPSGRSRYMPTPENERSAAVAMLLLRAKREGILGTYRMALQDAAGWLERSEHTF